MAAARPIPALPPGIVACLFDLDGVLTRTAAIHAAAWKEMFDAFLRERAQATGEPFVEFDARRDYELYVDGRPRVDGVRTFLDAREVERAAAVDLQLGELKNALVVRLIQERGVDVFEGSRRFVEAARAAGQRCVVVSSSANTRDVLAAAGLSDLFEVRIDAIVAARDGLAGKPAPDTFLAGARAVRATPAQAAVFEDALAGVRAGRAGDFGWVVGVDRTGQGEALAAAGADVVVRDLEELLA